MAWTSTRRGALCEVGRLSGNYDARPLSVSLFSRMRVALVCEQLYALLDMNLYIEISHRAYWRRTGAYDAFFRNRPTNKALELLKILTCVPVATVRARSRFGWKQAQRCVRPCGTPCTLWEECTLHKHGVRTHQHMSTGTCTAHHALHGVSRILNIPTVLPRISRLHLLDIRQ